MNMNDSDKDLLLNNTARTYSRITLYKDGEQIAVCTEDDYIEEWTYEDYRYVPEQGFIGQFVERLLDGKFLNLPESLNINDCELKLELGIKGPNDQNPTYYDYGKFLITKVSDTDTNGIVSFESSDYTKKFNVKYEDRVTYPCLSMDLLEDICDQAGVECGNVDGTAMYATPTEDVTWEADDYCFKNGSNYIKFTTTHALNKLDSLVYLSSTNTVYQTVVSDDSVTTTELTVTTGSSAVGTELSVRTCPYITGLANQFFVIDSNQFESDQSLRDVVKAIAKLNYTWARIGNDNKLYLDFTKKDTTDVDEYTTIDEDHYYSATRTGDTYGPVDAVSIGMSAVEGEEVTNTRSGYDYSGSEIHITNSIEAPVKLKLVGNTSQATSILPSEYQQVEYIQNTGTQYINTGYQPNLDNGLKLEVEYGLDDNAGRGCLLSNYAAANHVSFEIPSGSYGVRGYYSNGAVDKNVYDSNLPINHATFELKPSTLSYIITQNNGSQTGSVTVSGTSNGNIYMFIDNSLRYSTFTKQIKMYSCKMYEGSTLVRDFIPCYRISDNVIGMYDLVGKTFYTNAGTGTFNKGANVAIPNPRYPQDVKNVTGNNIINILSQQKIKKQALSTPKTDTTFWSSVNSGFTPLEDGWGKYYVDNSSGSSSVYCNSMIKLAGVDLKPNTQYTIVTECRNIGNSNTGTYCLYQSNQSGEPYIGDSVTSLIPSTTIRKDVLTTKSDFTGVTYGLRLFSACAAGGKIDFEIRVSILEGDRRNDNFSYNPQEMQKYGINLNKNLFHDYITSTSTSRGITLTPDADGIIIDGTYDQTGNADLFFTAARSGVSGYNDNMILLKAGKTYTVSVVLVSGTANPQTTLLVSSRTLDYGNFTWNYKTSPTYDTTNNRWVVTFKVGDSDIYLAALRISYATTRNGSFDNAKFTIQVEEDDKITPYEPYHTPIEMCDGDYFKRGTDGKWYKCAVVGKYELDGDENLAVSTSGGAYRFNTSAMTGAINVSNRKEILSNYFKYAGEANTVGNCFIYERRLFFYPEQSITTVDAFKAWLTTHNTVAYYPLATPVETEITYPSLIEQLDAIYEMKTLNGQTNVTQTNDGQPFIINLTELRTILTLDDNPMTYTEELRRAAIGSSDRLLGVTYTPVTVSTVGYPWLNGDDYVKIEDVDGAEYYTYPFNRTITYKGYIESSIDSIANSITQTKYDFESEVINRVKHTEILVDRNAGEIRLITESVDEINNDITNLDSQYAGVVSQLESVNASIDTVTSSVTQLQTDTYTKTEIRAIADGTGVDGVKVSAVQSISGKFDMDGMHYEKSDAPTKSTINEAGLKVSATDSNSTELLYAGYDNVQNSDTYGQSIVRTDNLTVTNWTVVGKHGRFEEFTDTDNHEGVGFFLV